VHVAQKDCQTCRAAIQSGDSHLQEEITYKELKSIEHTGTWKEITDPEGASLVDSKCVFQIKLNGRGDVETTLSAWVQGDWYQGFVCIAYELCYEDL
jgi:hypothetical protein